MKTLKLCKIASLVVVNSAMAEGIADPLAPGHSVLFPEIAKIMDLANSRGVGQRVSYEISNILDEHGMQSRCSDLGNLVSAIKNDSRVQEALSKTNTDSDMQTGLNLTNGAIKMFVASGSSVVADARSVMAVVDVISNDILRLIDEQMTQLRSAIYQTLPPAKINKCVRVY